MRLSVFLFIATLFPAILAAQELTPITNVTFQNKVTADQGLFNNVTGSTVSATTMTAGSLGVGDITSSGDITANAMTATTGTFTEIILGGGNIEEALFPLTQDADLGGFSLTNGGVVQARTGLYEVITLNNEDLASTYLRVDQGNALSNYAAETFFTITNAGILSNNIDTTYLRKTDAVTLSNNIDSTYLKQTDAVILSNNIDTTYTRKTESQSFSNTVYNNFLLMEGGVSNSVITSGRESGQFLKFVGTNEFGSGVYTHDFSSVRYVIGPNPELTDTNFGGIWTNVPSDKLEFKSVDGSSIDEISPISIIVTNVGSDSQSNRAHAVVTFKRNTNAVFGTGVSALDSDGSNIVTNASARFIAFEQGAGMAIRHTVNTNNNASTVSLAFDGSVLTNLVYRGEYSPTAVYSSNEIVVVTTDWSAEGEDPVIGVTLFADAYISQSSTAFTNEGPNPIQLDVNRWRLLSTRGSKGADGVANLLWGGRFIPNVPFTSNTFVNYENEIYVSLVDITSNILGQTNYSILDTNYWEKAVARGADGTDGVNAETEIQTIIYTNFPISVSNLNFRGDFESVAPYYHYDLVKAGDGNTYYLKTNATPGQVQGPPQNTPSVWDLFLPKGQDGNVSVSGLTFGDPITYTPGVAYLTNQVAEYEGSLWLCISNTAITPLSGFEPPNAKEFLEDGVTNNTYWSLFVPRGRDGVDAVNIGFNWRGEFVRNTSYNQGDTLYFDGDIWEVLVFIAAPASNPDETPSKYSLLIRSGTDGAPGGTLSFKGNWESGPSPPVYITNDVVYYKPSLARGGLWLALQTSGGLDPGAIAPSDTGTGSLYWDRLVSDGVDGASLSGLTFRGDWVAGVYGTNEVVRYQTGSGWSLWVSKADGNPTAPNANSWWLISSGIQGAPGGTGPEGPKGDKGDPGVGSLVFRGDYLSTLEYTTNDLVRSSNAVWYVTAGPVSNAPPPSNPSFWGIFLEDGADGQNAVGDMYFAGQYATNFLYDTNNLGALPMVQFSNAVYVLTNTPTSLNPLTAGYWLKLFEGIAGPKGDTGNSVTNAQVIGDDLFLYVQNTAALNAGDVRGPPGVGLSFLGTWSTNTTYSTNDLVAWTDGTYYSTQTNNLGQTPSTNSAWWSLFTPPGPQGDQGVQGVQGPQGNAGAAVTYIGVWNATNAYVPSNLVFYAGSTWYAASESTNKVPTDTLAGYWFPFATPSATLIPRGTWTNIAYSTNEVVYYDGSSYYSIVTNNTANPTNTASWQLLASKGLNGDIVSFAWTGASNTWVGVTTNNGAVSASFDSSFFTYLTSLKDGGATNISAGSSDSYNASTRTLTWNTNAVSGGGGGISSISIATEGSGNVVTNLIAGGSVVTQQLGTVSGGGGGLDHWSSDTGTATQVGSWFYPTNGSTDVGFFVGTNGSVSLTRPDGTVTGGNAVGTYAVSLVPNRAGADDAASGANSIAIGRSASAPYADAIAIGHDARVAYISGGLAIGEDASSEAGYGHAIGGNSRAHESGVAYGYESYGYVRGVAIGMYANTFPGYYGVAIGKDSDATAYYSTAIGYRSRATHGGSGVISGGGDYDKNSITNHTLSLVFNQGVYFTQTNTPYASITPSGITFPDGTTQTTAAVSGGGGGVTNLYDLNLVDAVNPSENEVLKFIGGVWTNSADVSGGGLDHWSSDTGTATQEGSWFYPTNGSTDVGFFVGTNGSISLTRPDGTVTGGNVIGSYAVSLIPGRSASDQVAKPSSGVAIGRNAKLTSVSGGSPVAIGYGASAPTYYGSSGVAVGEGASAGGTSPGVAIGQNATVGIAGGVSVGKNTSVGYGGTAVGDTARSLREGVAIGYQADTASQFYSIAIGYRAHADHPRSAIIGSQASADRNTVTNDSITLAFNDGLYLTSTNVVWASITRNGFSIEGNDGITVTQTFLDASSNIRTNIYIGGILVSGYTE